MVTADVVKEFIMIVLAIITAEFILCYIRPKRGNQ